MRCRDPPQPYPFGPRTQPGSPQTLQEDRNTFRQKTLKEQEERIAGELHRRKIEEFRDEKLVQKIRESSEELRELEEKLKAAYCTKERKAQIEEKQIVSQIRGEEEVGSPS